MIKTASEHFNDLAMEHLMLAGGNDEAAIAAFHTELEKIAGFLDFMRGAGRMVGGARRMVGKAGGAIAEGAVAAGGALKGGAIAAGDAIKGGVNAARGGLHTFEAAARGVHPEQLATFKADKAWAKMTGKAADKTNMMADNMAMMRQAHGLEPTPVIRRAGASVAAEGAGAAGAAGAAAAPGVPAASFGQEHFGTQHLQGAGGLGNWWQNATGTQKMKTLGAGVGGLYGVHTAHDLVTGQ